MPPVIFAGGQAFQVQGQYAIPAPDVSMPLSHALLIKYSESHHAVKSWGPPVTHKWLGAL